MRLSQNFTLDEFSDSETAKIHSIDNTVTPEILKNLLLTAQNMELVRKLLGDKPIHISSGYRCELLNKLVGGTIGSAHISGYAADFLCPDFGRPDQIIQALTGKLEFDQLIDEQRERCRWIHISFAPRLRCQVFTRHT